MLLTALQPAPPTPMTVDARLQVDELRQLQLDAHRVPRAPSLPLDRPLQASAVSPLLAASRDPACAPNSLPQQTRALSHVPDAAEIPAAHSSCAAARERLLLRPLRRRPARPDDRRERRTAKRPAADPASLRAGRPAPAGQARWRRNPPMPDELARAARQNDALAGKAPRRPASMRSRTSPRCCATRGPDDSASCAFVVWPWRRPPRPQADRRTTSCSSDWATTSVP